jgi:hypothetical protein
LLGHVFAGSQPHQEPSLGGEQPQELLTDPATTKLATNVDREASSVTIDLDIDEPEPLAVEQTNPSVPARIPINERPPPTSSQGVRVEAALPFLVVSEPACYLLRSAFVNGTRTTDDADDSTKQSSSGPCGDLGGVQPSPHLKLMVGGPGG